jgi:hypothetical protein
MSRQLYSTLATITIGVTSLFSTGCHAVQNAFECPPSYQFPSTPIPLSPNELPLTMPKTLNHKLDKAPLPPQQYLDDVPPPPEI